MLIAVERSTGLGASAEPYEQNRQGSGYDHGPINGLTEQEERPSTIVI